MGVVNHPSRKTSGDGIVPVQTLSLAAIAMPTVELPVRGPRRKARLGTYEILGLLGSGGMGESSQTLTVIHTKRFVLRDFMEEDAPAFEAYHADARSLEFYGPDEATPGHARKLLEIFKKWACEHPRRNYQLAIVRRNEPGVLVGCCGLRRTDPEAPMAELGIELAPDYWGRHGYAIEVMNALVEFGFGSLGLNEMCGDTVSANARMARLVHAFGAVAIARPTPAWMAARGWSRIEWQITRELWESGRLTRRLAGRPR